MTNYEKICAYINAGHYAVCRKKIGDSTIFAGLTIHGEATTDLDATKVHKGFINCQSYERIYPLPRPIPKYKVGDKVVVLNNIKEFEVGRHFTVGEVCVVINNKLDDGTVCIGEADSTSSWYVLPHCVAPYFDDDIEEMTVEQICKALGKNIKIVK